MEGMDKKESEVTNKDYYKKWRKVSIFYEADRTHVSTLESPYTGQRPFYSV